MAFEIVLGAEQALPAGLALALGDGAQRVETPRDGREKALLGLHVGGDGPEQRRLRLVGAVGAAQSLDGGVGLPSGLQQIMHAQAPVLRRQLGVIAERPVPPASEKTRMRLTSSMNACGLGEVGGAGAVLDDERSTPSTCLRMIRRERPVTSATMSVPKRCTIWSSAPCTGVKRRQASRSSGRDARRRPGIGPAGRRGRPGATTGCLR